MAQWMGQFSGLSHWSKLADAEATLRTAVAAFRSAAPTHAASKAKAVRRLAARVLNLRVKKIAALRNQRGPVADTERARAEESATLAAGVASILAEFGAADA